MLESQPRAEISVAVVIVLGQVRVFTTTKLNETSVVSDRLGFPLSANAGGAGTGERTDVVDQLECCFKPVSIGEGFREDVRSRALRFAIANCELLLLELLRQPCDVHSMCAAQMPQVGGLACLNDSYCCLVVFLKA